MPRLVRIVIPGIPHHVIQRGNRSHTVFFSDADKQLYLDILKIQSYIHGLAVWCYCLMDNHVHLIVVPEKEESLALGIGEAHRKYTLMINRTHKWKGGLWQGRFVSYPMDEFYTFKAIRYIERNPLRAKIVKRPADYAWSSARSHILRTKNDLLSPFWLTEAEIDWNAYLGSGSIEEDDALFLKHERSGRPLGRKGFLDELGIQKIKGPEEA